MARGSLFLWVLADKDRTAPVKKVLLSLMLISGNIYPNPGPKPTQPENPYDFKYSSGSGHIHLNVRNLINKIDAVQLWANSTASDFMVLTQMWLKSSITNHSY